MTVDKLLNQFRSLREPSTLKAGALPKEKLASFNQGIGLGIWLITGIFILLIALFLNEKFTDAFSLGFNWGLRIAILYWLWPIIYFFIKTVRHRRFPDARFLENFSPSQKI